MYARLLLPVERIRDLRNTINEMGEVVKAFDATRGITDDGQRLTMLPMTASVARALMLEADGHIAGELAQWPAMRDAIAKVETRMASKGDAV